MVLPKSSSSVFISTNLDYVLRSMGVKQVLLCGCVTDQCVEHAVRDACDLGYLVTMVTGMEGMLVQGGGDSAARQRACLADGAGGSVYSAVCDCAVHCVLQRTSCPGHAPPAAAPPLSGAWSGHGVLCRPKSYAMLAF
jgi:hypothetical protein